MNIHEHQAKEILKEYGAPVPRGIAVTDLNNLEDKLRKIDAKTLVLKPRYMLEVEAKLVELN